MVGGRKIHQDMVGENRGLGAVSFRAGSLCKEAFVHVMFYESISIFYILLWFWQMLPLMLSFLSKFSFLEVSFVFDSRYEVQVESMG